MLQNIRRARENESGFTLIELLIVVVILGVLAGIVVFAVANFQGEGEEAACKADVKNVEIAQEARYAKVGSYAGNPDQLTSEGYLRDNVDGGTKYTITTGTDGVVHSSGACAINPLP